jgi:hypothetical protein
MLRGIPQRVDEPRVQQAFMRFMASIRPALENLERLCAASSGP